MSALPQYTARQLPVRNSACDSTRPGVPVRNSACDSTQPGNYQVQ